MKRFLTILATLGLLAGPGLPLIAVAALAVPATNATQTQCPTPTPDPANTDPEDPTGSQAPAGEDGGPVPVVVVFPLPAGTWVATSPFGWRVHPTTGVTSLHTGTDWAAPDGTAIMAAAKGTVTFAGGAGGYGNLILIAHTIDGEAVTTGYAHMWDGHLYVTVGDQVTSGQHIGDVGSQGNSTGPHLHFEVRPAGAEPIDPIGWLAAHTVTDLQAPPALPRPLCPSPTPSPDPGAPTSQAPPTGPGES